MAKPCIETIAHERAIHSSLAALNLIFTINFALLVRFGLHILVIVFLGSWVYELGVSLIQLITHDVGQLHILNLWGNYNYKIYMYLLSDG